jgi:hypothetical protein
LEILPLRIRPIVFRHEGHLEYNRPGISTVGPSFVRNFFWLGSLAIERDRLQSLAQRQFHDSGDGRNTYRNIAWPACTGEALLYFSDAASGKVSPRGIINLTNMSKVEEVMWGVRIFALNIGEEVHHLKAADTSERDGWMANLMKRSEEYHKKGLARSVVTSSTIMKTLESLLVQPRRF